MSHFEKYAVSVIGEQVFGICTNTTEDAEIEFSMTLVKHIFQSKHVVFLILNFEFGFS